MVKTRVDPYHPPPPTLWPPSGGVLVLVAP